jgi:hypothetical protein
VAERSEVGGGMVPTNWTHGEPILLIDSSVATSGFCVWPAVDAKRELEILLRRPLLVHEAVSHGMAPTLASKPFSRVRLAW